MCRLSDGTCTRKPPRFSRNRARAPSSQRPHQQILHECDFSPGVYHRSFGPGHRDNSCLQKGWEPAPRHPPLGLGRNADRAHWTEPPTVVLHDNLSKAISQVDSAARSSLTCNRVRARFGARRTASVFTAARSRSEEERASCECDHNIKSGTRRAAEESLRTVSTAIGFASSLLEAALGQQSYLPVTAPSSLCPPARGRLITTVASRTIASLHLIGLTTTPGTVGRLMS